MKISDIASETDLRNWLDEWISTCEGRIHMEWIEPAKYGSSVGAPDAKLIADRQSVGLELKYLLTTRKGIKWTVRPAQRRYHHMLGRTGGRSALLAYIPASNELCLVRGNNIPLRDYSKDPDSGCAQGKVTKWELNYGTVYPDRQAIYNLEDYLFYNDNFWSMKYSPAYGG